MVNVYKGNSVKKINIEKPNISIENLFETYQKNLNTLNKYEIVQKNNNDNEFDLSSFTSPEKNNSFDLDWIDKTINDLKNQKPIINLKYSEISEDGYIPQGLTQTAEKTIISAYKKNNLSKIYVYDTATGTYEGYITLNNKAHVGGIGFDKKNNILYVTNSKGKANAYNYSEIEEAIKNYKKYFPNSTKYNIIITDDSQNNPSDALHIPTSVILDGNLSVKDNTDKGTASTLYFYDDRVYIGTFAGDKHGEMVSYKVEYDKKNNKINVDNTKTEHFKIPRNTQGIAITEYNNKKYLITTQSIGITDSSITVFEFDSTDNLNELGIKYYNDSGIEGLHIDEYGNIRAVFEKSVPIIGDNRKHTLDTSMEKLLDSLGKHDIWRDAASSAGGLWYEITK